MIEAIFKAVMVVLGVIALALVASTISALFMATLLSIIWGSFIKAMAHVATIPDFTFWQFFIIVFTVTIIVSLVNPNKVVKK